MTVVMISRGSFSKGEEIANKVAQELNYECLSREVLLNASKEFNIPEIKLIRAYEDVPSILDRFSHGRKKYVDYIRTSLLEHLQNDNIVYHGFAGHVFVEKISHVLKVRVIEDKEQRINVVMKRENLSAAEASKFLRKIDEQRRKWSQKLYGIDPWDQNLYDLIIQVSRVSARNAVDTICQIATQGQFQTSTGSRRDMEDLVLTTKIKTTLRNVIPFVNVSVDHGIVNVEVEPSSMKNSNLVNHIREIKKTIPGIKEINLIAGKVPFDGELADTYPSSKSTKDVAPTFFSEL